MNTEEVVALRVLNEIASVNEKLIDLHFELKAKSAFKNVQHGLDLRKYKEGCLIDGYVEAEINDDQAYCWWLELRLQPTGWTIEISLLKDENGVQDVIQRFPDRRGELVENLLIELASATEQLIESARKFAVPS